MTDMSRRKTIGLTMIVKNEAAVILRCLESVRPLVDYMLIEDTGSTDGTQDLVRDYFRREGIRGEVRDVPWRDFAHNRTVGLELLRQRAEIDYALIIDADEIIVLEDGFDVDAFKSSLSEDLYHVRIVFPPIVYHRPQLLKNHKGFEYRGVLHEYVEGPPEGFSAGTARGFHMLSSPSGARSMDPKKYHRDAALLRDALRKEKDPFLISRYTFYLAQSLRDSGKKEQALRHYLKRATLGYWIEEVYISLYEAALLKEALGYAPADVIGSYLAAYERVPGRAEALHGAVRYCRINDLFHQGYLIGAAAAAIPRPEGGLFVKDWIYEYGLLDELSVVAYWTGRYAECLEMSLRLLTEGKLPAHERPRIEQNADFARRNLPATSTLDSAA
ncbi:glycosyltransferase family 2 protein [Methylobacterium durans]|uniref:glycosyltransferase family 2 protein n=1 Tax=Methylobacterium durans TaxID=2202825 RepID=UPI002AFF3AAE|nr:glycosyltransferase family 2 protein [Methylobacterium durans]MEA1833890.1 glycosyltransferase family 2 protein [Methylobacterium durans]